MNKDGERTAYLDQIEELRQKMIATALVQGINHPKVLSYSQQIDKKHNIILRQLTETETEN